MKIAPGIMNPEFGPPSHDKDVTIVHDDNGQEVHFSHEDVVHEKIRLLKEKFKKERTSYDIRT